MPVISGIAVGYGIGSNKHLQEWMAIGISGSLTGNLDSLYGNNYREALAALQLEFTQLSSGTTATGPEAASNFMNMLAAMFEELAAH